MKVRTTMNRVQYFNVIVEVDLECVEQTEEIFTTLRDHIECSFDEGNYIIVDNNNLLDNDDLNTIIDNVNELSDDDLQNIVDRYNIEKRLKSVTE